MNIGFYAPLKSPDSGIPSGDREMAKLLFNSLQNQGHEVKLVSKFKSREAKGLEKRQKQLKLQGEQVSKELIQKFSTIGNWRPDLWFTYHVFYKAPDLIGPKVSAALKIPYVIAEASHAPTSTHMSQVSPRTCNNSSLNIWRSRCSRQAS